MRKAYLKHFHKNHKKVWEREFASYMNESDNDDDEDQHSTNDTNDSSDSS